MVVSINNKRMLMTFSKEKVHLLQYLAKRDNRTLSNYVNHVLDKHLRSLKNTPAMNDYNDFCYEAENNI